MENWFDKAKVGLFVHWGINTCNPNYDKKIPLHKTFEDFEQTANDAGWSAKKWVDAARKMRASYITFAVFHSCLGYIKAWRSKIPGTYTTRRDFLGELMEEARKYDIKVVLYISGDTTGNQFFAEKQPWIFPDEYARYKNDDSVNILDDRDWQRVYCRDVIAEVLENYPDLAGFWFDGWNNPKTNEELFAFIHSKKPGLLNFRNNFEDCPGPDEDVMSLECFGKVLEPDFDLSSGAWHPAGRKEYCYVISDLSDWYQLFEPREDYDKNAAIRNFISVAASGWVAKIGLGPNIGGDFNGSLGGFIDEFEAFLSWAGESVFDTETGGLESGYLNDGAYAMTCHNKDGGTYYIHTLLPPKGDTLIIPDGGLAYSRAINLKTGENVTLTQKDGFLHISCPFNRHCAEDGDTIIKLYKSESNILRTIEVAAYMQSLPAEILIQCDGEVSGLLLYEDDTSAITRGGWAAPDNNRAKDYSLYISDDGVNYTPHISGQLSGRRGMKQINFPKTNAKFLKFCLETAFDTTDGYVKKFKGGSWEYLDEGHYNLEPELVIGDRKFLCDDEGKVSVWGAEGNNIYLIGRGAKGLAASSDDRLLAVMAPEKGRLRIFKIAVIG